LRYHASARSHRPACRPIIATGLRFKRVAVSTRARVLVPYVQRIGSVAMVGAGSHPIYYRTLGEVFKLQFE